MKIFFILFLIILGYHQDLIAQVEIPREGFPYCEPFTGSGPFENTKRGGEVRVVSEPLCPSPGGSWIPKATGESLSLTPNDPWTSGYVIVDVPFSSKFGIKASFEYFTYGGNGADGISFFMFDAEADPFQLGYLGGSLGYAPLIDSEDGDLLQPGISGGYIGIGFDEKGNFGNGTLYKPISDWEGQVGNSVSVRKPFYQNYDLFDRRITRPQNINGVLNFPTFSPLDYFTIASEKSAQRVLDCKKDGYRKVFIELEPRTAPDLGYTLTIIMLVNPDGSGERPVVIYDKVPYPFEAPPRLKIGFAGATGCQTNNHEIRNVTVNVSDTADISEPITTDEEEIICLSETEAKFEFKAQLSTSDAFITCLQLFKTDPGAPDNELPETNFLACGFDGSLCVPKCNSENYSIEAKDKNGNIAGTFYSELQDLNTDNFDQLKDVVNVRFEPVPGFVGETSVYYNVTDNYGLTSFSKKLTVIVNPYPVINQAVTIVNPSCDGQEDGSLSGLNVSSLVPGFHYEWLFNGVSIGKTGATNTYDVGTKTGVFALQGLNLGTYTLKVWNPSSSGVCYVTRDVIIDQETGTPVDVVLDNQQICEGTPVIFTPQLLDLSDAENPRFVWWKNNNKTPGSQITNGLTEGNVKYEIIAPGILTITGLPQSATPYEFFVEAEADPVQDVCPSAPGQLKRVLVQVLPPLVISATATDDLCRAGIGSILVNASGNTGAYTYSLEGGPFQNSNTFNGLTPGTYTIQVASGANCIGTISQEVKGSPELLLAFDKIIQPACGESNGLLEVSFSGGTLGYTLEFLRNGVVVETTPSATSKKVYQNLSPGDYEVRIKDANNCSKIITQTLINDVGIPITVSPMLDEICLGDEAKITPVVTTSGSAELIWYKDAAATLEIVSSSTPDSDGLVFTINSSTQELTVRGLTEGDYKFYLVAKGPGYCPSPPSVANIKVFPPITLDITVTNETCIGAADGTISIVPSGGNGNYEYSLNNAPFSTTTSYSNLAPGAYTIKARNDIGCEEFYDVEVKGPTAPITINTPDLLRASCDLENGSIENLQISGGWGNYQVEWRKGTATGPVIPGTINGAPNLGPDTYYVLITDAEGCLVQFSFVIEESSDPVYQLVNPINTCFGEPATIRPIHLAPDPSLPPTAFTEVKWYKEPGQVGLIQNGPDAQDPTVRYTIDDSDWLNPQLLIENLPAGTHDFYFYVECTGQEIKAELSVYGVPEVIFDTTPVTCFGNTDGKIIVTSGAIPEYQFSINGAAPIGQAALEALNLAAGTYTLEVITPAGCPQTATLVIESPSAPLAISSIIRLDPGCGASNGKLDALVSGGWLPYTITLTKNGTNFSSFTSTNGILSVSGLATGDYQFEITDAQGCQLVSANAELVDGPTQIQIDNLEICSGEDAIFTPVLDPVAAGVTYSWTFDAAGNNPITSGSTVAGVTYLIGANGILTVSGLATSNTPYKYYLTASGVGVCTGFVANAEARVFDTPQATFTVQNEVCFGEGGQIQVNVTGGSGTYTFSLNGQPEQTANIFQVPVGTHNITVNTPQGCFVELFDIPVMGPTAAIQVTNISQVNPSCELANGSITFSVTGGYGDYSVDVLKNGIPTGSVQADANGVVTVNGIGFGTYEFEISDAEGCVFTLDEPLDLVEAPTEITANDQSICEGEAAQILPSVPSNIQNPVFTWYFDANEAQQIQAGTVNGVTYALSSDGQLSISGLTARPTPYTYYVMASGPGICGVIPKPVNVEVFSIPTLRVSNPSVVCDPEGTVDLTDFIEGFNPNIYDYDVVSPNGSALILEQLDAVALTGDYRVSSSLKNANCWNQPQRIRVIISDSLLVANFQYTADLGDGTIGINDKIQIFEPVQFQDLTTGRAIIWNWDFGDGAQSSAQNPVHTYNEKGTYTVTLSTTDLFGCQSEYVMQVNVTDEFKVMVPNAFTPSGQKNQYFKPVHRGIAAIDFYIFNTWGELIYHSNGLEDSGWDGTLKGENVPNGNYVYKVKYQTRSGDFFELSGVFILIR